MGWDVPARRDYISTNRPERTPLLPPAGVSVVAIFDRLRSVVQAIDELRRSRFTPSEVGLALPLSEQTIAAINAAPVGVRRQGALAQAGRQHLGKLADWYGADLRTMRIPGAGPALVVTAQGAATMGTSAGATTGGGAGALAVLGVPPDYAESYVPDLKAGRFLVEVYQTERGMVERATGILHRHRPRRLDWYEIQAETDITSAVRVFTSSHVVGA